MDRLIVCGGNPLHGSVAVSGAKNSALPAMAAAILTEEPVVLEGMPTVRDVKTMAHLLAGIGGTVADEGAVCRLQFAKIENAEAPYDLVKTMRASVLVLGPLLARAGRARVSLPGGCAIGARPINLHLVALEQFGVRVGIEHGYVVAETDGLKGGRVHFETRSVTGTENVMMAAALARGDSEITNCAMEPEIRDLADLLNAMGAKVEGAGGPVIRVHGASSLHGATHRIIPDRIEAGTFLAAAAITGGEIRLQNARADHLAAVIAQLRSVGCDVGEDGEEVWIRPRGKLFAVDMRTAEYPGFPTDMQAQYMALMTQAEGISVITETIFENRFMHVAELRRLGARIRLDDASAIVNGKTALSGARIMATDLRASASLLIAALAAEGETVVERVYHIDRGYERIEEKLVGLGANVRRASGEEHG